MFSSSYSLDHGQSLYGIEGPYHHLELSTKSTPIPLTSCLRTIKSIFLPNSLSSSSSSSSQVIVRTNDTNSAITSTPTTSNSASRTVTIGNVPFEVNIQSNSVDQEDNNPIYIASQHHFTR
jgi:hypothetical protein